MSTGYWVYTAGYEYIFYPACLHIGRYAKLCIIIPIPIYILFL